MKVETPQILWNSEEDKGINAALMSVSMLQSGIVDNNISIAGHYGNVMATAGNTNIINLWRVTFKQVASSTSPSPSSSGADHAQAAEATTTTTDTPPQAPQAPQAQAQQKAPSMFQRSPKHGTKIEYMCSLTRHDAPVNTVAFSPDGLHLATAGDAGSVIVWSVPVNMRGNGNGRHYWSTVQREQDLTTKVVSRSGEGVCDISWSADSKRFLAGTIDHSVFVCEDASHSHNRNNPVQTSDSAWKVVYRNAMDHTHYVQGVAYDPAGVYLASMSSDRTVRVYPRKTPPKSKKKVLRPANSGSCAVPPVQHATMVQDLLTESKLEMGKSKLVKFRRTVVSTTSEDSGAGAAGAAVGTAAGTVPLQPQQVVNKRHLYADESTLESFFRRLSWTTDGAFLVTPAALWQPDATAAATADKDSSSQSSYATYLFARHKFDEPYRVLSGLEKPSVAVRPNPVLFTLPNAAAEASKENTSPKNDRRQAGLPYRSIFAVLTWDSVLVYDTCQSKPLSIARGLHYSNLADATWSADGLNLVVCSTDGYLSILSFAPGELGDVYTPPVEDVAAEDSTLVPNTNITATTAPKHETTATTSTTVTPTAVPSPRSTQHLPLPNPNQVLLPPCEPGQTATIEAPPAKRAKKLRITPTLVSAGVGMTTTILPSKRPAAAYDEAEHVGEAVDKLSLHSSGAATTLEDPKPKKKKRIQPMLMSSSVTQQ